MGSIRAGKLANFVVPDRNLLTGDAFDILQAKLLAAIIDGDVVFSK